MERDRDQWVADLQSDKPAVADAAWGDLSGILFRIAYSYLHKRGDVTRSEIAQIAEEVTQEALVDILSNLDSFRGESKFTTWAYQIVINNARELLRKRSPPESYWPSLDDDEMVALLEVIPDQQAPAPELKAEEEDLLRAAKEIINTRLTRRQRMVLLLHLAGYTRGEISEYIGTTRNNVDQLLYIARKKLRKGLRNRGYVGHTFGY
ncbi:MAG: hypothetical protein DRI79_14395 [Chloroflexi bacterium]|nr:MAG: hypothetical protein DRI79_14395 [Chloroflexota bacterium]